MYLCPWTNLSMLYPPIMSWQTRTFRAEGSSSTAGHLFRSSIATHRLSRPGIQPRAASRLSMGQATGCPFLSYFVIWSEEGCGVETETVIFFWCLAFTVEMWVSFCRKAVPPEGTVALLSADVLVTFVCCVSAAGVGLGSSSVAQSLFCPLEWVEARASAFVAASLGFMEWPLPVAQSVLVQASWPHPSVSCTKYSWISLRAFSLHQIIERISHSSAQKDKKCVDINPCTCTTYVHLPTVQVYILCTCLYAKYSKHELTLQLPSLNYVIPQLYPLHISVIETKQCKATAPTYLYM